MSVLLCVVCGLFGFGLGVWATAFSIHIMDKAIEKAYESKEEGE